MNPRLQGLRRTKTDLGKERQKSSSESFRFFEEARPRSSKSGSSPDRKIRSRPPCRKSCQVFGSEEGFDFVSLENFRWDRLSGVWKGPVKAGRRKNLIPERGLDDTWAFSAGLKNRGRIPPILFCSPSPFTKPCSFPAIQSERRFEPKDAQAV